MKVPNHLGHIIECPDCGQSPDYYCDIGAYYQFWCKRCKATKRLRIKDLKVYLISEKEKGQLLAYLMQGETRLDGVST